MIFGICLLLIFLGIMGMAIDLFVPLAPETLPLIGMANVFGLFFGILGLAVIGIRGKQTGVGGFFDIPSTNHTINFHHRRGKNPNVSIQRGKLLDLEYIKAKNKIFKDTGGGFRIAGHDCRNTYETIPFDVPKWLSDYFYQFRKKTGARSGDEWDELIKAFRGLTPPAGSTEFSRKADLEKQLKQIPLMNDLMKDENKKWAVLDMGYDRIKRFELLCCDGLTHHSEEVEDFIDTATPNELDALIKQEYLNDRMKHANYKEPGSQFDYGNLINIGIGMFIAALATIVLLSYFGG